MKTLTICGSMRFEQEMKEIAFLLETQKGFNILQCIYTDREVSEEEKKMLAAAHYRKIDLSDGIYVVNIGGYIGTSVAAEIEYARKLGKDILYYCGTYSCAAHRSLPCVMAQASLSCPSGNSPSGRWHGEAVTEGLLCSQNIISSLFHWRKGYEEK